MLKVLIRSIRKMFWYHLGAWESDLDPETGKLMNYKDHRKMDREDAQ